MTIKIRLIKVKQKKNERKKRNNTELDAANNELEILFESTKQD